MPFELWGASGTAGIALPGRFAAYGLYLLYSLLLIYAVYRYRTAFGNLSRRQWTWVLGLALASFVTSQLFPIYLPLPIAPDPAAPLALFAAVPYLLAGAVLSPAAALVAGAAGGLGRALGQTHQLFDVFHFAFAALLAAVLMQQWYSGRLYTWLRQPAVSGALGNIAVALLAGVAAFVSVEVGTSTAAALDMAITNASANFWLLLIEGLVGGALVSLILKALPHLRLGQPLAPSPAQRSLSRRLLSNFAGFAALLIVLLVTAVYLLSISVSTRLVVNQMAHNARTVSAEIPDFQAQLQNLLMLYNDDESLLNSNSTESEKSLQQLFRINPVFRRIIIIKEDRTIGAFYPADVDAVALSELEQTAVDNVLTTSAPDIAPASTREDEQVLSFVVPVLDEDGTPQAALIGRVPRLSVENLIVGLQGTVGKGTGFIVDENDTIIAHPDSSRLLTRWAPPTDNVRRIRTGQTEPGVAYQSWQGANSGRELVYYVTEAGHPWRIVITVPYEVVLNLALSIGAPLLLVLLLVTAAFYVNLVVIGRDITRPIADMVGASKTMAAGGNWIPSTYDQRDDEIGQLSQAFVQMQQSMKKRLNELSLLLGVSHDVSTGIDLNQGMPAILRGALRGTGAAGARAVVLNPSGGHPLTYGEGPAAEAMAVLDRLIMTRLRHASELMLATPNQIRAALALSKDAEPPLPSLLAIPLYSHDRFQGILWLAYRQPHSFDLTERNLLRTLASQAAVLVENAHLFATAEGGRRRLAAVLASTSDAVIVTDPTERILLVNRSAEKIFDLDASRIGGRPVASVIKVKELVSALTGNDEIVRNLEVPTRDGKTYYASVATIISNEGQIYGRVAVLHDITHLKEIDDMKSEFVATVSHDLRSPLTFMRGYATMLPMVGELNEKQQDYADKILNGIDQMAQLVDDLLDLGRIEAGVDLAQEEIGVESLLSEVATEYWQHAHLSGIKLQVEVAPGVSTVMGDTALIRQAVTNLVGNGIKYAPNSGLMTLRAEHANGEVVISVKDNGPGIPQKDQMRLFEKFYRVKQRGTEKIKGSGLGLAIVKSIAERHGGRVWCHSQGGEGATFYISLPLEPSNNGNK